MFKSDIMNSILSSNCVKSQRLLYLDNQCVYSVKTNKVMYYSLQDYAVEMLYQYASCMLYAVYCVLYQYMTYVSIIKSVIRYSGILHLYRSAISLPVRYRVPGARAMYSLNEDSARSCRIYLFYVDLYKTHDARVILMAFAQDI